MTTFTAANPGVSPARDLQDRLTATTPHAAGSGRIPSLDQFRGYTVLGMFFVNFVGSFQAIPAIFKHHHTYCSYADTIMPQFLFAVGFALRLTFSKRLETLGAWAAYRRAATRILGLVLVALVIHRLDGRYDSWAALQSLGLTGFFTTAFQRSPFQTLLHIAVTTLWVLPVIAARPGVRVAYAVASAGLFHALSAGWFGWSYYEWVMRRPGIDGGPLGFLTWTIPTLVGSLAYDLYVAAPDRRPLGRLFAWGLLLMLLGYGASCLNRVAPPNQAEGLTGLLTDPPFVMPEPGGKTTTGTWRDQDPKWARVNLWTMSQRAGSVSYLTFGAGFSLALYALFIVVCDGPRLRLRLGFLDTLGANALAGYIIHDLVGDLVKPFGPRDSPLGYALTLFGIFLGICYLFLRYLEKNKMYLRL